MRKSAKIWGAAARRPHWKSKELIAIFGANYLYSLAKLFFDIIYWFLLARVIFSFLQLGRDANPTLLGIRRIVYKVTEPLLVPVRKFIKPVHMGSGSYIDLSPLVVILLLGWISRVVLRFLWR